MHGLCYCHDICKRIQARRSHASSALVGMTRARKETTLMNAELPQRPHSLEEATQKHSPHLRASHPTPTGSMLEHPKVLITGDIWLCVTESEAALHPITGHYRIETAGMQEPLYTLWHAEGQVLSRQTQSANIALLHLQRRASGKGAVSKGC